MGGLFIQSDDQWGSSEHPGPLSFDSAARNFPRHKLGWAGALYGNSKSRQDSLEDTWFGPKLPDYIPDKLVQSVAIRGSRVLADRYPNAMPLENRRRLSLYFERTENPPAYILNSTLIVISTGVATPDQSNAILELAHNKQRAPDRILVAALKELAEHVKYNNETTVSILPLGQGRLNEMVQ
ncbi:hypothetical protein EJ02DRAFT_231724 [Clathrospora elynae]|uniref:Uncharacterized protein n=1 Tax=Clathrospora elynae TaxID=706981 RepID=A0A6A5SKE3_9PLEO|nr:hypothetical protein EJ02DRAFT_231724 [Clathrospora elynae]